MREVTLSKSHLVTFCVTPRRRWAAVALLAFSLGCSSPPAREEASVSVPSTGGKATPGGGGETSNSRTVELRVTLEQGRPDLESGILTNSDVLNCLRQGVSPADVGFSVSMAGHLRADGGIDSPLVVGPALELRECLLGALKPLKFAVGQAGPFRLTLRRSQALDRGKRGKGKTLILDLGAVKKFE